MMTAMNTNATVNASASVEEKTKDQLRTALEAVGVTMSNTVFKKTKKAELVAMLEQHTSKVEIVDVGDLGITKDTVVVEEKKEEEDMKAKYNAAVWDKLVKALATEYVKQSLNVKWALFYKNSKSTTTKAQYLVKSSKLWGATSKVIKTLYGEANCNEDTIRQSLNAMVVRGYLNFQKVQGKNGTNVIFNASADQMNAMYKLSK